MASIRCCLPALYPCLRRSSEQAYTNSMGEEQVGEPAPGEKHNTRALRHQLLGKLLEIVLTPVDITVESEVQVMSEPPKADVLLLRRHGKQWSAAQRKLLPDGIRDRQAQHHLLECKFTESLNEAALRQALSYEYFYQQTQHLKDAELQTYVVSAKTPQAAFLDKWGYQKAEQPGVYVSAQQLVQRVVLLVLNELRDEPQNEFLRLFASRKWVRKQTIERVFQQPTADWPAPLLTVIFGLQRLYELEATAMNRAMTVEDVMKMGDDLRKQAIASASPEERLAGMDIEEFLANLAPEKRLAGMAPEERLAGMAPEERLAGMAPEELVVLLKQIEALLGKQSASKPRHRTVSDQR